MAPMIEELTTAAPTAPPLTEPPPGDIYDDEEYYEFDNRVPLANGWFAEYDEEEDMWYIFDEMGVPLGAMRLPDGTSIEEFDFEDWIPLAVFGLGENAELPASKPSPQTGETGMIVMILAALGSAAGFAVYRKSKKHT